MPRPTGPEVAMAAAPPSEVELEALAEAEALELESSEEEELLVEVPVEEDPVVVPVAVPVEEAAEPLRVAVERVELTPATGEVRPAGMEAAGCWEVMTLAWLVTTLAWLVTASGWPVTTPRELVSVRYWVAGLLYYSRGWVGCVLVAWFVCCVLFVLTSAVGSAAAVVSAALELWALAMARAERVVKTMEKRILIND